MFAEIFRPDDFFELSSYFHRPKRLIDAVGPRVTFADAYNLPGTDPYVVGRSMQATTALNPRCLFPLVHLVMAWHPEDQPTPKQMRRCARRVLRKLGLSEHEIYLVGHGDRDHPHLHALACRVHPVTGRVVDIWKIKRRIAHSLRRMERIYGWKENPSWLALLPDQSAGDRTQSLTLAEYRRWARTGFSMDPEHLPIQWVVQLRAGDVLRRFAEDLDRDALEEGLRDLGYRLEARIGKVPGKAEPQLRGHVIVAEDGRKVFVSRIDPDAPSALLYPEIVRAARRIRAYARIEDLKAESAAIAKQIDPRLARTEEEKEMQQKWTEQKKEIDRELGPSDQIVAAQRALYAAVDVLTADEETVFHLRRLAGDRALARVAAHLPPAWGGIAGPTRDERVLKPGGLGR